MWDTALSDERARLHEEMEHINSKLQGELDDIAFRIGVETKAIAGLTAFDSKLKSDLYVLSFESLGPIFKITPE